MSLQLPLPDPEAGSAPVRLARGLGFVLRGQLDAFTHPRLRKLAALGTLGAALFYSGPLALLSDLDEAARARLRGEAAPLPSAEPSA